MKITSRRQGNGAIITTETFFQTDGVRCPIYQWIRNAEHEYARLANINIEGLWQRCAKFVDKDARERALGDLPSVWWELYLADLLLRLGKRPVPRATRSPRNQGPDLLTEHPRVWIEAVLPERTEALADPPRMRAYSVPNDAYLLRLTSAIQAKSAQLITHRDRGYITPGDATVVAISAAKLNYRFNELPTPRIVSAVLAAGPYTVTLNRETKKITDRYHEYRDRIEKTPMAMVRTDIFLRPKYAHVSALLYSPCDWIKPTDSEIIVVHNPLANVQLPKGWLGVGREYWSEGSEIHRLDHSGSEEL